MSGVLLDTTVIIDVGRGFAPTTAWLRRQAARDLYLSAVSVAELLRGPHRIASLSAGKIVAELEQLRRVVLPRFAGRILAFDAAAAEICGRLMGDGDARGRTPPRDDAMIAAIALHHGLTVATSNTTHFAPLCPTIDPRTA